MDTASRYAVESVLSALDTRTQSVTYAVFRNPPVDIGNTAVTKYQWRQGDRWDYLAQEYLQDPRLWYRILDMNPFIQDPFSVEPGTIVLIPSIMRASAATSSPPPTVRAW